MRNIASNFWFVFSRVGALILAAVCADPARAQSYPDQIVKIIVPFTAGGGVDVVARIIAPKLGDAIHQTVIVENRGGAGGMIGASAVAQSQPDGYTLLLGTVSTHGTNVIVYSKLTYDPIRDFTPIVMVSQSPLMMVARPTLPAKSLAEFITLARSEPGKLSFGSYGVGSINQFAAELLNSMADIRTNHVPYRGSAPALSDLMGGQIDYIFDGVSTSLGYVKSGMVRLLGIASESRTPVMPEAPTIAESGLPGFDATVWFGIFAPAGTPKPIVELLNVKINAVLAEPSVKESFTKLGFEVRGGSPDELARRVHMEIEKWTPLVRDKKIQIDP